MFKHVSFVLFGLAVVAALPHSPILRKLSPGLRYEYAQDDSGQLHLVDLWGTLRDLTEAVRYNPDTQNVYHLFTRNNPTTSQPLVLGSIQSVLSSNYNPLHRTVILLHGWGNTVLSQSNAVMLPAFLAKEDANVIVVDWSAGSGTINYPAAVRNTVSSGEGVARFINWLESALPDAQQSQYHIAGFSLGGQQSGVVGRNLVRSPAYITSLDPAGPGWVTNEHKFQPTDGIYTEVIHTNVQSAGYLEPLGDVDFYPNGGNGMPGCVTGGCDHDRAYFYFAESLQTGGFTGQRCENYQAALIGNCTLEETLQMGGLVPKTGKSGIYYLKTSSSPPFSLG
ncbi:hypothetical protein PYW07_012814 [Mythimna separata]|uniref:Lipase domain-containing protein n=1 Tax=Mythimna separata TaxID=271217 RepID=A0AAD7Y939_MYTSE|nr:hypothetical protein PYW07_012814 [Mythimna separata]